MDAEKFRPQESEGYSYGSVLREVGTSVRDLVQSEVDLVKAEIKESTHNVGRHAMQASIFGALLAISVMPFLAFLVVGIGEVFGGNYWLSSLIVAVLCAVIGGSMAVRAYKKIKEVDLSLPRTRRTLEKGKETVAEKAEEVKETTSENVTEIRDATKRRAS